MTTEAISYEHAIIGAAILACDKHGTVDLEPADFLDKKLAKVWEHIRKDARIDNTSLCHAFGDEYISGMIDHINTTVTIYTLAAKIRDFAYRRRLGASLQKAATLAGTANISELASYVMSAIDNAPVVTEATHIREFAVEAYNNIAKAHETGRPVNFIPTGFIDFDSKIGGLQKDGLIIVAGRPSMGKTAFAMGIARNVSSTMPVLGMSMEMSGEQLAMRMLAAENGVDLQDMMQGKLVSNDWRALADASGKMAETNLFINEIPRRTISDISAEARRFKRKHESLGLVVIDYLGLMDLPQRDNMVHALSEVTRQCKLLAKELHAPVMLLCQLNRKLEDRKDKAPMMSDLRDSGAIEQDADQIIMPFRPSVYMQPPAQTASPKVLDEWEKAEGIAEIRVVKNRNGRTGVVMMSWMAKCTSFRNIKGGFDD